MCLVLSCTCCSCVCPIHWSHVSSREWRCSWSSANRRCSNSIWVSNKFIAYCMYQAAPYIRGLTVVLAMATRQRAIFKLKRKTNKKTSNDTSNLIDYRWHLLDFLLHSWPEVHHHLCGFSGGGSGDSRHCRGGHCGETLRHAYWK